MASLGQLKHAMTVWKAAQSLDNVEKAFKGFYHHVALSLQVVYPSLPQDLRTFTTSNQYKVALAMPLPSLSPATLPKPSKTLICEATSAGRPIF